MVYDLPKIELNQINNAKKQRLYRIERDRLKPRYFVYSNYPVCNYYGLNIDEAKSFVFADFISRYKRLKGRNVLFSLGYNNTSSSILKLSMLDKPLSSFVASGFSSYQKELNLLEIGIDEEKEVLFNSDEYIIFVQKFFQFLYEKDIISLKHGEVIYDDNRIYQKGEYYLEGGKYYSLNGKPLLMKKKNYYALSINSIKKNLTAIINELNLNDISKSLLLDRFMYKNALKFTWATTNDIYLELKLENPEYVCGLSFVVLNPNYVDVKPFIDNSEYNEIADLIYESNGNLYFSGTYLKNPIINSDIPIFISDCFKEAIHLGIPSVNEIDENICSAYDLEYNPIFDFIGGEKVLVNSGWLNGISLDEANEKITQYLINYYNAEKFSFMGLEELNISSLHKFGIPVPIKNDHTLANIPVIYNLKHDVKLEAGELADKFLVKDFICDDFVEGMLVNAIRLKTETGILDFESKTALDDIGLFNKIKLLTSEFYTNNPCRYCVGNGCDDCRDCSDAKTRYVMENNIYNLKKQYKELYGSDYDEDYIDWLSGQKAVDVLNELNDEKVELKKENVQLKLKNQIWIKYVHQLECELKKKV